MRSQPETRADRKVTKVTSGCSFANTDFSGLTELYKPSALISWWVNLLRLQGRGERLAQL